MSNLPLEGYRVIDFGQVWVGPIQAHILADFGAEVIIVETNTLANPSRPALPGQAQDVVNLMQRHARNKYSVTLNLREPQAVELAKALVATADIVIENFAAGVMKKMGLDYDTLRQVKPDIIMISDTGAGQYGPYSSIIAYGPAMNALTGTDSIIGYEDDGKLMVNMWDADPTLGVGGILPILAALYHRKKTGQGQYIDACFLETLGAFLGEAYMEYGMNGRMLGPQGNTHRRYAPHGIYPCAGEDRWLSIAVTDDEEWRSLCRVMGNPGWSQEPRFADAPSRRQNYQELDRLLGEWTRRHGDYELMEMLQKAGVAGMPVLGAPDLVKDPQDHHRRMLTQIDVPGVGEVEADKWIYGIPWTLSDTPGSVRIPAHAPGQDNDHILTELIGVPRAELERLIEQRVVA